MLHLKLQNLKQIFETTPDHSLDLEHFLESGLDLERVKTQIISRNQGFIDLPTDQANLKLVLGIVKEVKAKYNHIVLIGIGGSSLGPKCLLQALGKGNSTKVHIVDNIDPDEIQSISDELDYAQTLFLVITKSGATPETIATYLHFRDQLERLSLSASQHFIFITDPIKGYLREISKLENIVTFDIPENVGGRFSVLSNVGLIFAGLMGFDLEKLLAGAQQASQDFWNKSEMENSAWNLAKIQFELAQKGKTIQVIMPYSSRLNSLGDWYVQLLSESLGKELSRAGLKINVGLTPIPAVGATDQHSQLQLFKEGPNDKLIIFIQVLEFEAEVFIPKIEHPSLGYLSGYTFAKLIQTEYEATSQSLTESSRPNITITIPRINAFYLGQLFQFFELAVACLGELYNINTFDQPGVERGKILTKQILENKIKKQLD